MRASFAIAAAALLLACPPCALAQPDTAAAKPDTPTYQRAYALAQLLDSEATIIGDAQSDEEALAMVPELFGANPDLADLEQQYPGIGLEIARALLPITNRSARERLPQLWERHAAIYADNFSAAEIDRLIAFYGSPTGAKLIAGLTRNLKPRHSIEEAKASDDFSFSGQSVISDIREAVPGVLKDFDAADRAALIAFGQSGLLPRVRALGPQIQQVAIEWYNESAPWEDAETERVLLEIIARREEAGK